MLVMCTMSHWHLCLFFYSRRRRHTRFKCDWSSDVCSSDLQRQRRRVVAELVAVIQFGGIRGKRVDRLPRDRVDRKSVVEGKRVDLGGRRIIKKKNLFNSVPLNHT